MAVSTFGRADLSRSDIKCYAALSRRGCGAKEERVARGGGGGLEKLTDIYGNLTEWTGNKL